MSHDIVRTLSVGQAVEIQDACRRQEVTLAELKLLTSGTNLRRSINWLNGTAAPAEKLKLLESVATVPVTATTRFVAADRFVADTSKKAKVKIAFAWDNFKNNFVPKVETDIQAGELKIHKLLRDSLDKPIIAELGANHETYLADLWAMLLEQPNGEKGKLLVNGRANIFYIRDVEGVLWAVSVGWGPAYGGWVLCPDSVSFPAPWDADDQVVSR